MLLLFHNVVFYETLLSSPALMRALKNIHCGSLRTQLPLIGG
uniref:MIOREX complex component 7 n=1 Tax=Siphoviridae sp. ctOCb13 TaxID=2825477 RepID=A0A8S5Q1U6_9CAUD|nr:MAG TPA: MIOREX complex component 7 [Siphoviridae sp. ctOCb13]